MTEKFCVDRAAYFFLFFGQRSGQEKEWERSEHQKTRFRAWEMITSENKQKKNFRFFAIAWAEPRFSVRQSVLSRSTARTERYFRLGTVSKFRIFFSLVLFWISWFYLSRFGFYFRLSGFFNRFPCILYRMSEYGGMLIEISI